MRTLAASTVSLILLSVSDDSTFIAHADYSKNPATAGTKGNPGHVRLVGDTIWLTFTGRWDKDTTKFVRGTTKYVRLKQPAS